MQYTNKGIDIPEDTIFRHPELLDILLIDRTTSKNIIWATDSYKSHKPKDRIKIEDITGVNYAVIQPRIIKSKDEQKSRTKDKAEVFTPKEIVEEMNKQIDWQSKNWPVTEENWREYVSEKKLEITCGEAPFIVGRYNAVNGKKVIELDNRVGFLDRKMQVIKKYCCDKNDWLHYTKIAFQSSYGYEWQGDNLLLARENLLYTFIDYWNDKFANDKINLNHKVSEDKMKILKEIAEIISWNIFQMDGLKYVVPMSCKHETIIEKNPPTLFNPEPKINIIKNECPGCKFSNPTRHNGKYVRIMDWGKSKPIKFVKLIK